MTHSTSKEFSHNQDLTKILKTPTKDLLFNGPKLSTFKKSTRPIQLPSGQKPTGTLSINATKANINITKKTKKHAYQQKRESSSKP